MGAVENNYIIGLDVDGVLANFYKGLCLKYNKPYKVINSWGVEWMSSSMWKEVFNDKDLWENLPLLSSPDHIDFDFHYYITALPSHLCESRVKWLNKFGFPSKPVITSQDKLKTCKELNVNVLIDDKPETIKSLKGSNILPIQFMPWYFGYKLAVDGVHKIGNLKEINNILYDKK